MKKQLTVAFLMVLGLLGCDDGNGLPKTDIDLKPFLALPKNTGCDDIANRLFLIDKRLVFWDVRGECPDGSYTLVLFEETVDDTVCILNDSIAGPQGFCQSSCQVLFETITNNLDVTNLGLGNNHLVERINF